MAGSASHTEFQPAPQLQRHVARRGSPCVATQAASHRHAATQPLPARARVERRAAAVEERPADERGFAAEGLPQSLVVDPAFQELELSPLRGGQLGTPAESDLPAEVFQGHPHHEDDEFELGRRRPEQIASLRARQQGFLERQPVVLRSVVPDDQQPVCVEMDELPRGGVVAVVVQDPWHPAVGRREDLLESEAVCDLPERGLVLPPDQQVEVVGPVGGAIENVIALPVAVVDLTLVQLGAESCHQLERCFFFVAALRGRAAHG